MHLKNVLWVVAVLAMFSISLFAQNETQPVIKHVPVTATSPTSGQEMYKTYCAVCHGEDGKGNGPAATALKATPTDLTTLAKKNGGKFPDMKVSATLRGEADVPAHGTREMPVWGQLFWTMSHGHEGEVQQRVANLTKYIESLQEK
jgi:mono/diheme cytochrome c family protein